MCITFWRTYKNPQKEQIAGKFPNWQQSWRSRPWKVNFLLLHFILLLLSSRIISFTKIQLRLEWNICLFPELLKSRASAKEWLRYLQLAWFVILTSTMFEGLNDNYSALPKKIPFLDRCGFRIAGHARRSTWPAASQGLLVGKQQRYLPHGCNHHRHEGHVSNAF